MFNWCDSFDKILDPWQSGGDFVAGEGKKKEEDNSDLTWISVGFIMYFKKMYFPWTYMSATWYKPVFRIRN